MEVDTKVEDFLEDYGVKNKKLNPFETVLKHYGILGMKWGVRRSDAQIRAAKKRIGKAKKSDDSVSLTRVKGDDGSEELFDRKGRRVSSDAATAQALKKRAVREGPQSLTNAQMQDLITRMQLENKYSNLNPKKQNPAVKFVQGILMDAGKQAASQYSAKYSKQLADALASKADKKKKKPEE